MNFSRHQHDNMIKIDTSFTPLSSATNFGVLMIHEYRDDNKTEKGVAFAVNL